MGQSDMLERANGALERIREDLLANPAVSGFDVGLDPGAAAPLGRVAIRVYVKDASVALPLPAESDGIPVVVIQRRFQIHPTR